MPQPSSATVRPDGPSAAEHVAQTVSQSVSYGPLTIAYDSRVLTPRDWTREQSTWAADVMHHLPDGPMLELCTGAGHIGLLAAMLSSRHAVLVDVDPIACHYARRNAEAAGLTDSVEVRHALAQHAVEPDELFACILVDPPWVPTRDIGRFPEDPELAINGGEDGLGVIRDLVGVVATALHPRGAALVQLGTREQARELEEWLDDDDAPDLTVDEVRAYDDRGVVALLHHR